MIAILGIAWPAFAFSHPARYPVNDPNEKTWDFLDEQLSPQFPDRFFRQGTYDPSRPPEFEGGYVHFFQKTQPEFDTFFFIDTLGLRAFERSLMRNFRVLNVEHGFCDGVALVILKRLPGSPFSRRAPLFGQSPASINQKTYTLLDLNKLRGSEQPVVVDEFDSIITQYDCDHFVAYSEGQLLTIIRPSSEKTRYQFFTKVGNVWKKTGPSYEGALPFRNGFARIQRMKDEVPLYGLVDRFHNEIFSPSFRDLKPFRSDEKFAPFKKKNGWIYYSRNGDDAPAPFCQPEDFSPYGSATNFSKGLAAVVRNDQWHFIDEDGSAVHTYEEAEFLIPFSEEGYAAIAYAEHFQIIGQGGELLNHKVPRRSSLGTCDKIEILPGSLIRAHLVRPDNTVVLEYHRITPR